jgi:LPS sulfotransferase NodH
MSDSPVLVLGSGHRTGSTLVQRLLTSHPDVMIWGEHGGVLRKLLEVTEWLEAWDWGAAEDGRQAFDAGGHDGWIANVMPEAETVREAARAYVRTLFETPAAANGRSRWGFKEVRMTREHAEKLHRLFAGLTAIHITRNPRSILVSLDAWERQGIWKRQATKNAVEHWVTINASFLEQTPEWALSVRYEDITADPDSFVRRVAELIGVPTAELDRSVFDRKVRGYSGAATLPLREWGELPRDLRGLLKPKRVREVAAAYGYEL